MKNRSLSALLAAGLLLATASLALTACGRVVLYKEPENPYAGRPIPPSKLLNRVMAAYSANGSQGGLEIIDGLRDLRGNIENTIKTFGITGYTEGMPTQILNFPEQLTGYVFSANDGALTAINYSKESSSGQAGSFGANSPSVAAAPQASIYAGSAPQSGVIVLVINGASVSLNLPNAEKVAVNVAGQVILVTVRNSDALYRIVRLPSTNNPVIPPGSVDCEPLLLPAYCVVPVTGKFDRPVNAIFSLDGTTAYVLNGGAEAGGTASSVSFLQMANLNLDLIPTIDPTLPSAPSAMSVLPVANPILIPGGATDALPDGTNLYISGQQLQTAGAYRGLFAGNLTLLNLSSYAVGAALPISDGNHTRMLFADDNTLWIGSSQCANGVRAATAATELSSSGTTDQAGNYNCLTLASLNASNPAAQPAVQVVPAVVQVASDPSGGVQVPYPNTNQNDYYYGSATGICWVQLFHKVFTAYGGQIHAFYTGGAITNDLDPAVNTTPAAGTEINNYNITVQGTVLDVAYIDAETNSAD